MDNEFSKIKYLSEFNDLIVDNPREWAEMIYELDSSIYWQHVELPDQKEILIQKIHQAFDYVVISFATEPTLEKVYTKNLLSYLHFKLTHEDMCGYSYDIDNLMLQEIKSIKNVTDGYFTESNMQTTVTHINTLIHQIEEYAEFKDISKLVEFKNNVCRMPATR
jgi:hypothetical protein